MTVFMLYLLVGCMDTPRLDTASTAEKAAIALRGPILTDVKLNCGLNVAYVTLRSMGYTLSLTELTAYY